MNKLRFRKNVKKNVDETTKVLIKREKMMKSRKLQKKRVN